MEFLQVLRRFFCFEGLPAPMTSGDDSHLVGAERELWEKFKDLDTEKLREFAAERGMK